MTATKRKDLKQLLKNEGFAAGFDALVDVFGLWTPIKLGTLHRFHALRCDEVSLPSRYHPALLRFS